MASTDGKDSPPAAYEPLDAVEAAALRQRRALAFARSADPAAAQALPRVGLALSGGGVRSATFAIGLIRGLAKGGLLNRIDFLSTVSGGGYAGAVFGRLVALLGHEQAGRTLADDQSDTLDWLRRNGRYLTPTGSRDYGIALVTYLRALLAIHTEALVACAMVGLLVIAPHLWHYSLGWFELGGWQGWITPWWAAATLVWLAIGPGLIGAYWIARETHRPGWADAGLAVAFGAAAVVPPMIGAASFVSTGLRQAPDWRSAVWMMLLSLALGIASLWIWLRRQPADKHPLAVAEVRNALTRWLRAVTLAALGLVALGVLDRLSWWALEMFATQGDLLWSGIGVGSIGVIVLRVLAQPLQQVATEAGTRMREWLPRLINIAGWLGLSMLVMGWMVATQWFVFAPDTFGPNLDVPPWIRAAGVAATCALWLLLTAGNAQMANGSSLHSFYRARLVRAYLAVGNARRGLDLAQADAALRAQAAPLPRDVAGDVTRVVEGDDMALAHYKPDAKGGPIHLINTCLNQTRDDRTSLYNADRKGSPLTVSAYGIEFETHPGQTQRVALADAPDVGNLGRWAAISGAAASPGAGSYTSRGLALLLYFLGVRLGHWVAAPRPAPALRWLSDFAWRRLPKPVMLTSEAAAMFFGRDRPWWYLSDGGHFENTGVYALLRRELDFIILSDASSDADFEFKDIENLVRKARIDLGAEIDFYGKEAIEQSLGGLRGTMSLLAPEDMGDQYSRRGVLLARVRYRRRGNLPRRQGTLLVVKPNLHQALDVDLLGYARNNPMFPHESTGDQSFDEAQWESYHRLGSDFGRALSDTWLRGIPGWLKPAQHENIVAARLQHSLKKPAADAAAAPPPGLPAWRRSARAAAIGTTLGLGASGTLLLSLWQVQDQLQRSVQDQQKQARELFTQVSQDLQKFKGSCPVNLAQHQIARANLLFDLRGSSTLPKLERAGVDRLVTHVTEECTRPADASEECLMAQQAIYGDLCARLLRPPTEDFAVNYWHPRSGTAEQWRTALAVADRVGDALFGRSPGVAGGPDEPAVVAAAAPSPPTPAEPAAAASGPDASASGSAVASAGGVDLGGLMAGMPAPDAAEVSADKARQLCRLFEIADGPTTLYLQVYDDPTGALASRLRGRMQLALGDTVRVIEAENVNRNAELRGLRRPVPWPKPTFVIQDERNRPCAVELARFVREPWFAPGSTETAWVRSLPAGMARRPGVIELWLPPPPTETLMAIEGGMEQAR